MSECDVGNSDRQRQRDGRTDGRTHLEGLAVLALPSPLSEQRLLLLVLLLLLQGPDVLLEADQRVLVVHVWQGGREEEEVALMLSNVHFTGPLPTTH